MPGVCGVKMKTKLNQTFSTLDVKVQLRCETYPTEAAGL